MKKLLLIIFSLSLVISVEAQVSVRRSAKKEKTETSEKVDKKTTTSKKETKSPKANALNQSKAKADAKGLTDSDEAAGAKAKRPVATDQGPASPVKRGTATAAKRTSGKAASAEATTDGPSLRRQLFEQNQPKPSADARWQHIVYRELDLEVEENSALYYPQEPVDGLTNFFQIIFEALLKNQIKAYEYLDGREVFTEKYLVKIESILETHEVMYNKTTDKSGKTTYEVEQSDIPSHLVMSYYIKEKWDVDPKTSQFGPRVLAICPVLHKLGDVGGNTTRYPLFWIDYNDLRPFISNQLIMTSGMNSAARYSIDDFFNLNKYKGEIYKVQNPRGLTLMQQYPDTAELRVKRAEIDSTLQSFGSQIYPKENVENQDDAKGKKKKKSETVKEENSDESDNSNATKKKNRRTKKQVEATDEDEAQKPHSVRRSR